MSNGSKLDYNFGRKNQWRKWVWNQLSIKIKNYRNNSIVLYLGGPNDYDRAAAMKKGFSDNNLIAVDNDIKNVAAIRDNGGMAIHGDLSDVLMNWGQNSKIRVVHADFCCGLTRNVCENFLNAIVFSSSLTSDAAICVNFLRGRDQASTETRRNNKIRTLRAGINNKVGVQKSRDEWFKHRGKHFFMLYSWLAAQKEILDAYGKDYFDNKCIDENLSLPNYLPWFFVLGAAKHFEAKFNTYRAKNGYAYMDSVVFSRNFYSNYEFDRNQHVKRKVAATKAVRTMRFNKKQCQTMPN